MGCGCGVFVRLAQMVEHRSYEPKVESSILSVNIWGGGGGRLIVCVKQSIFWGSEYTTKPSLASLYL